MLLKGVVVPLSQGLAADWRATHDWLNPDGSIAIDVLERDLGSAKVWATDVTRYGQHML